MVTSLHQLNADSSAAPAAAGPTQPRPAQHPSFNTEPRPGQHRSASLNAEPANSALRSIQSWAGPDQPSSAAISGPHVTLSHSRPSCDAHSRPTDASPLNCYCDCTRTTCGPSWAVIGHGPCDLGQIKLRLQHLVIMLVASDMFVGKEAYSLFAPAFLCLL